MLARCSRASLTNRSAISRSASKASRSAAGIMIQNLRYVPVLGRSAWAVVRARADVVARLANLTHVRGDVAERGGQLFDPLPPVARLGHRFFNQGGGFPRRGGRALREVSHFFGDRGKPETGLAGTGRFNGCVQG